MDIDLKAIYSGLYAIIKYSTKKILFKKQWIITLLIVILMGFVMGYAGSQDWIDSEILDSGMELMDLLILSFVLPIISMIYGASLLRNEIEDKSITQVIIAPLDRAISYLGYYISLVLSLSLIMAVVCVVGWLAFFGQLGVDGDAAGILGTMIVLTTIGSAAYSAMFLLTSILFKRPIYFGLFYAFIWEGFIGLMGGAIGQYTIKHFIRAIGSGMTEFGSLGTYMEADASTYGILIVLIIALLGFGALLFKNKEFP